MTITLPTVPDAGPEPDEDEVEHLFSRGGAEIRVRVRQLPDAADGGHLLIFGELGDNPLVRLHSRCLYGDALGSDDCDCGPELARSMDLIQAEGGGVLVYLEQEGRGAGLLWKARGYRECERHDLDTFTGYDRLGLPPDARSYAPAAAELARLGLTRIRLLTNNPDKLAAVQQAGIAVEVLPLAVPLRTDRGRRYLEAKRTRRGHMIPGESAPWAPAP
ncbi:GTP cyclohydrolase II [Nocardia thailandica]